MKNVIKKGINHVALLFRILADMCLWLATQIETLAKQWVMVKAGRAFLVKRLSNNSKWTSTIERNDFIRSVDTEPMFPIDLGGIGIEINVNGQKTHLRVRRKDDDASLIELAYRYSETILSDNQQLSAVLTPIITQRAKYKPDIDWLKQEFEGCFVVHYQVLEKAA